ncbi:MAG: aminotransferase class I/II-fold pyridoxal phosphate-dependent enzyme, partial [Alphaproteobacteria bacterium]
MSFLSKTLSSIKESPTIAISTKASELKAQGLKIISLGMGEPDFDTPENIKQAGINAIKNGETKYTAVDGTPALKKAIVNKLKRENNLEYKTSEISVSTGAKQVIYNALIATLNPEDEVIIPAPYWVSYPDMVLLGSGVPVIAESTEKNNFKI